MSDDPSRTHPACLTPEALNSALALARPFRSMTDVWDSIPVPGGNHLVDFNSLRHLCIAYRHFTVDKLRSVLTCLGVAPPESAKRSQLACTLLDLLHSKDHLMFVFKFVNALRDAGGLSLHDTCNVLPNAARRRHPVSDATAIHSRLITTQSQHQRRAGTLNRDAIASAAAQQVVQTVVPQLCSSDCKSPFPVMHTEDNIGTYCAVLLLRQIAR